MCTHSKVVEGEIEVSESVGERQQVWKLRYKVSFEAEPSSTIHHALNNSHLTWIDQRLVTSIWSEKGWGEG